MTDAQAIAASLEDPEVFAVLFDRHFDAVHAYAQRRVGPDLADEVAAEAFTRAFDQRSRYDRSREDARPWLLGISANLLRRHWRTERRRLDAYARSAGRHEAIPAGGVSGELVRALKRLPRREREPLLLLAWADLSYEQIAVALSLPIGTVRSRISRARARLTMPAAELEAPKEAANSV